MKTESPRVAVVCALMSVAALYGCGNDETSPVPPVSGSGGIGAAGTGDGGAHTGGTGGTHTGGTGGTPSGGAGGAAGAGGPGDRAPGAGVAIIWGGSNYRPDHARMLQANVQWLSIEPQQGAYDWSSLNDRLAEAEADHKPTMVQVNATAPDWVFQQVAAVGRVTAPAGVSGDLAPQFWDPVYIAIHLDMIEALGAHIAASVHRNWVVGVRVQGNAFGTEFLNWDTIAGINPGDDPTDHNTWQKPGGHYYAQTALTTQITKSYLESITDKYIEVFHPLGIRTGIRTNWWSASTLIGEADMDRYFADNPLMMVLGTGARLEMLNGAGLAAPIPSAVRSYRTTKHYVDDYDAWVYWETGGVSVNTPTAPTSEQNIYWLALARLDAGTTYSATYALDMQTYDEVGYEGSNEGFDFTNKYAGFYDLPRQSPGAWLVFAHFGPISLNGNDYPAIDNLGFHISQEDPTGTSQPVENVGDPQDHQGWRARQLTSDTSFRLNDDFLDSIQGESVRVKVTYLDQTNVSWQLMIDNNGVLEAVGSPATSSTPGQWKSEVLTVNSVDIVPHSTAHLSLALLEGEPVVHMLEVERVP